MRKLIPRTDLIFPPPPDVAADIDDLLADRVPGQQVIELLHGFADDLLHTAWDVHLLHQLLVPGHRPRHTPVISLLVTLVNLILEK